MSVADVRVVEFGTSRISRRIDLFPFYVRTHFFLYTHSVIGSLNVLVYLAIVLLAVISFSFHVLHPAIIFDRSGFFCKLIM